MKTVLINANIFTMNPESPWAHAMVLDDETISYIGPDEKWLWSGVAGDQAQVVDMRGKYIYPGFVDSHIHPGMVSESAWHIRLPWTEDMDEILTFIEDFAKEHPKEEMPLLYFEYYPTSLFGDGRPDKRILDRACHDRPVMCQDFGEHEHWYNSKMLAAMEVFKDTKDPIPGMQEFVRDEHGEPIGCGTELVHLESPFLENLFRNIGWTPPDALTPEGMTPFFDFIANSGITSIADGITEGEAQLQAMYELDLAGKLHVYYDGVLRFYQYDELLERIKECKRLNAKYNTKHIKINTMKLFLDGTNEIGNSASLHPHIDDPNQSNYGQIAMETDELKDCLILCNREGVDIHIHMVGDRAFRVGCDAVEQARLEVEKSGELWRCQPIFAHCEIIDPSDMTRPTALGIIVNVTCHWCGGYFGEEAMRFFSKEKWDRMYQFNPIIQSGGHLTFSSDVVTFYELHRANPFFGMQVAATRVDPEFPLDKNRYPGSMRPQESAKLSVLDLMRGYTINGAKQMRLDNILGSLEVGKIANMNVCSENIETANPATLGKLRWDAIIFEGKVIRGKL
jgi:hypothetical protein